MNEVEAAGNTPLHSAAYEGWIEGAELLLSLGAKVNASNNAGDRPWHWAQNMGHEDMMSFLVKVRRGAASFVDSWGGVCHRKACLLFATASHDHLLRVLVNT